MECTECIVTHLWGKNESLSLKQLSWKTAMLLALTCPSRSPDLSQLNLTKKRYKPDGVAFISRSLAKQSRQGKPVMEYFFPSLPHDTSLCPVAFYKVLPRARLLTSSDALAEVEKKKERKS